MPQPDLTIAIPVRNEERNFTVCLQAIGSDFATKVAIRHEAELINFNWNGHFPKSGTGICVITRQQPPEFNFSKLLKFSPLR